ncbi:MAG: hypothetical protein ACPGSW_06850 [Phaeobacter italicus]
MISEATVRFDTSGLLSKWGFCDGNLLDDLLYDSGFEGHDWLDFYAVLATVVREKVAPQVDQQLELADMTQGTIHNPMRAGCVDGVEVDWRAGGREQQIVLTPEFVDVPVSEILAVAQRLSDEALKSIRDSGGKDS